MVILEKKSHENSRAYALRVLIHNIVFLELEPGTLISENEISASLNLSRTPVREALIELKQKGLVDIHPQRGSYISKIDYNIIDESRFIRLVLELAIVRLACVGVPPEYKRKIEANLAEQKICLANNDILELLSIDNNFHKLLFDSVGKSFSYEVLSNHMLHYNRLRVLILKNLDSSRIVTDHECIYNAIINHDRDLAEKLISDHLNRDNVDRNELFNLFPEYFCS